MKNRNRNAPADLAGLGVPPHRQGFWRDVEDELAQVEAATITGSDAAGGVVGLGRPRPPERRISPWFAASAAAILVLVLGGATAILTRPAADLDVVATPEVVDAADDLPESLSGTVVAAAPAPSGPAPWSGPRLRIAQVPALLGEAWSEAENQRWCSAMAPATLASLSNDATPRRADFTDGWAVAWDAPDGPGQFSDGTDCADCGRSAFGVAGSAVTHEPDTGQSLTADITWDDGSFAHVVADGGDEATTKLIAKIVVAGQGCVYEVWSNRGEEHLNRLVGTLRVVEGMIAAPVELRTASDLPDVVVKGQPPWALDVLGTDVVDPAIYAKWSELGITGRQLVLADLGASVAADAIREWGSGVAWNNDAGPGHNGQNQPCADCGRGAMGLGWRAAVEDVPGGIPLPNRIEWADGSYAEYGGRGADPALPRDRVLYFDPDTGAGTIDALQAIVHVAGSDIEVVVWSHLGEAHLLDLIDQLRWVQPPG